MSTDHLRNVLRMLHDHAQRLHLYAMVDATLAMLEHPGASDGEVLAHHLAAGSVADVGPGQWLEATPVVRAIRAELRRRDPLDADSRPR